MAKISEYHRQAINFLNESGTDCTIHRIGVVHGFPFDNKDTNLHVKYHVVLKRDKKIYDFPFFDSAYNYLHDMRPTSYDVLACLQSYPVEEDVWDFAREFGYTINSKESYERVANIHRECVNQYKALLDLFGEEWMNKLAEIN